MWSATAAEAEKRFKAAYEGERNTLQVVDAYGRFLAKRGRKDEALKVYKAFDEVAPRHPIVRSAMKALEEGKPLMPLVTNAQDGAAELLYGLGVVGNTQGDELTAIIYLRLGLDLKPRSPARPRHPRRRLRAPEAIRPAPTRSSRGSRRIRPCAPSADISIGQNFELMGRGDDAIAHLEKLMKERPDDVEVVMALGNVQRSRKKFAEAAETYDKAIKLDRPARARPLDPLFLPRHVL